MGISRGERKLPERLDRRRDLAPPAVDEEQVREDLLLRDPAEVPASDDLGDHREVVRPLDAPDAEASVLGLRRAPALEDDDRADRLVPLEQRDVDPLDPVRERREDRGGSAAASSTSRGTGARRRRYRRGPAPGARRGAPRPPGAPSGGTGP